MKNTLITKDSKNKIRVVILTSEELKTDEGVIYLIHRLSGQKGGKMTVQPDLKITSGKVKRTAEEQCILQYNSELKKYLDKGYKKLEDFGVSNLDDLDDKKFLSQDVTNQNGVKKPMLCKVLDKDDSKTWAITNWYGSKKIDGLRVFVFWKNGEVRTSSRGGSDYDIAATYIRQDESLKKLLSNNPNLILDCELYHHEPGIFNLQKISGLGRLETITEEHKKLELYCYDIVDETKTFKERLAILNQIKEQISPTSKLIIVEHKLIHNYEEALQLHDYWVSLGYEGLVIRDANAKYKCGARDRRMQKLKLFTTAEATIIDLIDGLRDEDMCFLMEWGDHIQFKAKPVGSREQKDWYRNHINELKGKLGTIKYFNITPDGKANLPVFLSPRIEKDI